MSARQVECGFIPLVDAAPLLIARELGFAAEEGIDLVLHREPSWSALRDKLAMGRLDAAQMLAPIPVAMSMGIGGMPSRLDALSVLSVNGTVIGVAPDLAAKMRDSGGVAEGVSGGVAGGVSGGDEAKRVGSALIQAAELPLTVGVPFPFSMQAELLYYWLGGLGLQTPQQLNVRTVPPPQMADAIEAGEIDAFCVGEPWGSLAAQRGVAELILPGCAIWRFAPEKVLAVRHGWAEREVEATAGLMRAVWRAAQWLSDSSHHMAAAELVSGSEYLDITQDGVERTLSQNILVNRSGLLQHVPGLIEFYDCAATFPWRSQAAWIAARLAARMGMDRAEAQTVARACFRPDLYREFIASTGADMPGASEKLEGSLTSRVAVASANGQMFLGPDAFFDGVHFDPEGVTI